MSQHTINIVTAPPLGGTEGPDLLRFNVYVSRDALQVYAESRQHCDALGEILADTLHRLAPGFAETAHETAHEDNGNPS